MSIGARLHLMIIFALIVLQVIERFLWAHGLCCVAIVAMPVELGAADLNITRSATRAVECASTLNMFS